MKSTIEGEEYLKTKRSIVTLSLITLNILLITFLTITIWYQRHELVRLNENIKIINHHSSSELLHFDEVTNDDDKIRRRREVGVNGKENVNYPEEQNNNKQQLPLKTFYTPLYAAITEDMIDEVCKNRKELLSISNVHKKIDNVIVMTLDNSKKGPQYSQDYSTKITINEEKKEKDKIPSLKKETEILRRMKTCSRIIGLGLKTMHSEKRTRQNGIIKNGASWFVSELSIGYTIFEIPHNNGMIDFNDPKEIYTLPSPFVGPNHAYDRMTKNYYYITDDGSYIMKFNLITLKGYKSKKYPIITNSDDKEWNINIYYQANGTSDLHIDSGYLWMVYNKDKNNHLTISRIDKSTLEEIRRIRLNKFDRKIVGTFISCGILYAVECEGIQCRILSVYDLIHGKYVLRKDKFNVVGHWNSFGTIRSISFDEETKSLAILDKDKIYSIHLKII